MRSGNPTLNDNVFAQFGYANATAAPTNLMTVQGTVWKTGFLLLLAVGSATYSWTQVTAGGDAANAAMPWIMGGAIAGLVLGLVTSFWAKAAPFLSPLYALAQGLFLGGISAAFEAQYPGIAFQAVGLTVGTLGALLLAYTSRLIRATENFKLGVVAATGGIAMFYMALWIMSMFGFGGNISAQIFGSGVIGIGISVVVVIVAALNLVLDFDFIENGAARGAPKYMEWYGAFGLMVTLVWLYLEILRLLSKLRSRD